ncbi:histidine phosphatase family protein [Marivivens aquimaris]|uniref:histidine phosphatase family protein n=1 Tax=Marivivens aquimaris TaxID=2774876 RepID=UPI00187E63C3|nr:histidine phosphatase family protein [Marivivens aquimaris]
MGTITFVRHGQANSHADNEDDYDRLSELGHQQANWLGEWLTAQGETFDHVITGSMRRHLETARGAGFDEFDIDERLNELDYFNLSKALSDANGTPPPSGEEFVHHIGLVIEAWHSAEIQGHETFASFENRVAQVLDLAVQPGRNVLCITSGGVIAMIMRHLLDLAPRQMAMMTVPIYNSSLHRVHVSPVGPLLAGFNAIPHLEAADRVHARTHF